MRTRLTMMIGPVVVGLLLLARARGAESTAGAKAIEPAPADLGRPVDFEKDVAPILESNCLACHNAGINEGKLSVETAEAIRKGGKRGPAIISKDPAASLLFQFASRAKQPAMPPLPNKVEANALTPKELGVLKQWILEGAAGGAGGTGEKIQWQPIPAGMKSILSVALSRWGRFVAAGRVNQIVIYDVILGREVARLTDPKLSDLQFDGRPMYPDGAADRDFIHALAFSPDESLLAAGGYRVVKLWKRPQNVQRQSTTLPERPTAVAVSPDGTLIAAATADKAIQLLTAAGAPVRQLSGPTAAITCVQFSTDGKTLFAGSLDKSWRSWTVADGAPGPSVTTPAAVNAIALSKDGSQLLTAGADGTIRVWSRVNHAGSAPVLLRELKGHAKGITSLALVLPAGTHVVSGSDDGTVRIWQIASGKQIAQFDHSGPVTAVAVRPDGQVIASAGTNGLARLWQTTDGKRIAEMKGDVVAQRLALKGAEEKTIADQHVATATAHVKAAQQDVKERHEAAKKAAAGQTAADKALAEAKNKEKSATDLLAAAKKEAQAKPKDGDLKKKADEAQKALTSATQAVKTADEAATSARRGKEAADKTLTVAEERLKGALAGKDAAESHQKQADKHAADASKTAVKSQLAIRAIAFSADGRTIATAGDDPVVQLWDAREGRALESFRGHSAGVATLAFAGSSSIISAAADQKLIVWDTNPSWQFVGRIGPKADAPLDLSASPFVGRVLCLAFNAEGTLLATGGGEPSRSGELKVWNIPGLSLARDFKDAHSDTVFGVEFSRDGKYVASGAADKFVKIFDLATGKHVRSFEGHTHHVLGVTWKADGSLLASAGADSQIKVWNVESGEQLRSIVGYGKQVTSIQFIGTGDNIVSSGGDKTVRLHRTSDGGNFRTFEGGTDFMYSAAADRDESLVVAGGEDGVLRVWNGKTGKSLMTYEPPKSSRDSAQASAAKH